jgi:hypothetical protein
MRSLALEMAKKADSAGIVLMLRIVEALGFGLSRGIHERFLKLLLGTSTSCAGRICGAGL